MKNQRSIQNQREIMGFFLFDRNDDSSPNYPARADRTEHSLVEKQDQAARNRKEEQVKANQASCHFTQSELLPGSLSDARKLAGERS